MISICMMTLFTGVRSGIVESIQIGFLFTKIMPSDMMSSAFIFSLKFEAANHSAVIITSYSQVFMYSKQNFYHPTIILTATTYGSTIRTSGCPTSTNSELLELLIH